jgi:uncharacterized membrane protein
MIEPLPLVRVLHLLAAAVWTGGLIVLGALVLALRRAGVEREVLRAAARQFARVSWPAMLVALATGIAQVELLGFDWGYGRLHLKLVLVALAVVIAFVHQKTAGRTSPALRGALEGTVLVLSLAIFAAAVAL